MEALLQVNPLESAFLKRQESTKFFVLISVWSSTTDVLITSNGLPPLSSKLLITSQDNIVINVFPKERIGKFS